MKKITHDDLISRCQSMGINVVKITKKFAHIEDSPVTRMRGSAIGQKIPNNCHIHPLCEIDIYWGWNDRCGGKTLFQAIQNREKISAIKIIRAETGCGLKDAKDICDSNWTKWGELCRGIE